MSGNPKYGIPYDYLEIGVFNQQQVDFWKSAAEGTNPQSKIETFRAKKLYEEINVTPELCDTWFMDMFLKLLQKCSPEVGIYDCILSEAYNHGHRNMTVAQRNRIQLNAYELFESEKYWEKRFIVSFFNVSNHWYWYICDQFQSIIYFGDSFNQYSSLQNQRDIVPDFVRKLFTDHEMLLKMKTFKEHRFTFQAVKCPRQIVGDSTSCGPLACASIIAFLNRVYHDNFPIDRFGEPISSYESKNGKALKQRLVLSYVYGNFNQKMSAITYNTNSDIDMDLSIEEGKKENVQIAYASIEFSLPDASFFGNDVMPYDFSAGKNETEKQSDLAHNDPIAALTDFDPSYFPAPEPLGQNKVFVDCQLNPKWQFGSLQELLVTAAALLSNVNKKGSEKTEKIAPATTERLIAKAELIWKSIHGTVLGYRTFMKELSKIEKNPDDTMVPKSEQVLSHIKEVWRVTEKGYQRYLMYKSPNCPGPCIFKEVQSMKGRKPKNHSGKMMEKSTPKLLVYSPYDKETAKQNKGTKTWIKRIQPILAQTHCPQSLDVIVKAMTTSEDKEKASSIRQGIVHGCSAVQKRKAKFYKFDIPIGKKSKLYCGLIENYEYRHQVPQNVVLDEWGKPRIMWKEFVCNSPLSGCLTITIECQRRAFYVDDNNHLAARCSIPPGTVIEYQVNTQGEFYPDSLLLFMLNDSPNEGLHANCRISTFFGVSVLFVIAPIAADQLLVKEQVVFLPTFDLS